MKPKPDAEGGRLTVRLPKDLLKRVKLECVRRETTLQAATEAALRGWLQRGGDR